MALSPYRPFCERRLPGKLNGGRIGPGTANTGRSRSPLKLTASGRSRQQTEVAVTVDTRRHQSGERDGYQAMRWSNSKAGVGGTPYRGWGVLDAGGLP